MYVLNARQIALPRRVLYVRAVSGQEFPLLHQQAILAKSSRQNNEL